MNNYYYNESSYRYIGISEEPCKPENILWTDEPWQGRVTFTGPEGNSDYRAKVEPEAEHRYVGIGTMSLEGTSEASYIWRAAPKTPFPTTKSSNVGEIGWAVPEYQDWSYANTCRQIMLGHFRQELEDRHFHRYQNPWYPGPLDTIVPGTDAAMVMNVYKSHKAWPMSRQERVQSEDMSFLREPGMQPGQRTLSYLQGSV